MIIGNPHGPFPRYDDASREIYYTVKEIGSYPNYTSKPTLTDGRDQYPGFRCADRRCNCFQNDRRGDGTFTFRLVGPEIPTMKVLSARMGPSTNGRTTTPEWWWKSPAGTYTLYEFPLTGIISTVSPQRPGGRVYQRRPGASLHHQREQSDRQGVREECRSERRLHYRDP